jgi:hypothetical protein
MGIILQKTVQAPINPDPLRLGLRGAARFSGKPALLSKKTLAVTTMYSGREQNDSGRSQPAR